MHLIVRNCQRGLALRRTRRHGLAKVGHALHEGTIIVDPDSGASGYTHSVIFGLHS